MSVENISERKHILESPFVYDLGIKGVGYLPRRLAYAIAERGAELSYLFYKKARKNIQENLSHVLPDASSGKLASLSLNTFRNYSKYLVDYGRFNNLCVDKLFKEVVHVDGTKNIDEALARGKGLIMLTAHLGNWELGGIFFGRQDIKINILTARDAVAEVDAIRSRYRKFHNINTIVLGDSPFDILEVLAALRRNEIVAMLVDRGGMSGPTVPFFGKSVTFPEGPIKLAKETGAPIIAGFVLREKDGYRAVAESPIYYESSGGDAERNSERIAKTVLKVFERYIRKYPDQWYNFAPF
jgi:KDO2-lipid IV(A) lauroyltransferase